ncbi:uncharacterized protein LOC144572536 [Carex rostrata]
MSGRSGRIPFKRCKKKHDTKRTVVIDSDNDESDVHTVDSPEDPLRNNSSTYLKRSEVITEISDSSSSDCEITIRDKWEDASSRLSKGKNTSWSSECIADMPDVLDCLSMIYTKYCSDNLQDSTISVSDVVVDREKHKETAEYRHAEEAEWESRKRLLQTQAEEARRARKKRKAESLRQLEMEKRQKQRLEEIRQSQKKVEEMVNLKEKIRAEVRKELEVMERRYGTMASILRALGVTVEGGPCPLSHQVNAAYKQAIRRFHPDRFSTSDIHEQVKAEETFKFVSRLKEKRLPNL